MSDTPNPTLPPPAPLTVQVVDVAAQARALLGDDLAAALSLPSLTYATTRTDHDFRFQYTAADGTVTTFPRGATAADLVTICAPHLAKATT